MKRILAFIAAVLLLAGLCACGGRPADVADKKPAATDAPGETAEPAQLPEPPAGMTRFAVMTEDLDGDGGPETVLIDSDDEYETAVTVLSGERTASLAIDYPYAPRLYTLHSFWNDGTQQIVLSGDTGSNDYLTVILRYADGALSRADIFGYPAELPPYGTMLYPDGYPPEAHNDGTIIMSVPVDVLGTYGGLCVYTVNPDMSTVCSGEYLIETYEGFEEARTLTVQRDGLTGKNEAGETLALPKGTKLLLKSTNLKDTVCCSSSLGYDVYLGISRPPEEWQWYIDGQAESEWFGELMYTG